MKPVEIRIRIGRIVSDQPLGARREQFAESLSAEVAALLEHGAQPGASGNGVASHVARAIAQQAVIQSHPVIQSQPVIQSHPVIQSQPVILSAVKDPRPRATNARGNGQ